jgi:hypothetical protein
VRDGEVTADLFGFLTTEPNAEVAIVHPQAMAAILTTEEERETWLRAPWSEASALQLPLPNGSLGVALRGEKQDGTLELVNLAAAASAPHAEMPLPLLDGTPDRPRVRTQSAHQMMTAAKATDDAKLRASLS